MSAAISNICEEIIKNVVNSNLDYKMNQTPYSLYFSIRKKLTRNYNQNNIEENKFVEDPHLVEGLRHELLYVRNEYQKLYGFYQLEMEARAKIEAELDIVNNLVGEKDENNQKADLEIRQLKHNLKDLQSKYETKCVEYKQLRGEIESVSKDKNALSVALKSSKQNAKEQNKAFEKNIDTLKKKLAELNEFKNRKLSEEREEKIRKRKDLKKAKQKLKKIEVEEIRKSEDLNIAEFEEPLVADVDRNGVLVNEDDVTEKLDGEKIEEKFERNKPTEDTNYDLKQKEKDNNSNIIKDKEFAPKLMSNEEKETFFAKLSEDFKKKLEEVNKPFLDNLEKMRNGAGDQT